MTPGAAIPTIIRNGSRKHYVVVDHETVEDLRLSARALGFLTYLLGKPNNWQVKPEDLARRFACGKDYVYAGLKELRQAGYAARQPVREDGRIVRWEMVVYERYNPELLREKPEVEESECPGQGLLREKPEVDTGDTQLRALPDLAKQDLVNPTHTKEVVELLSLEGPTPAGTRLPAVPALVELYVSECQKDHYLPSEAWRGQLRGQAKRLLAEKDMELIRAAVRVMAAEHKQPGTLAHIVADLESERGRMHAQST